MKAQGNKNYKIRKVLLKASENMERFSFVNTLLSNSKCMFILVHNCICSMSPHYRMYVFLKICPYFAIPYYGPYFSIDTHVKSGVAFLQKLFQYTVVLLREM